jgi:hypothetical protein
MYIRRVNVDNTGKTQGFDQEELLPAVHLLVGVVAAAASGLLYRLHPWTVHDGGTWLGVATNARPLSATHGRTQQMPEPSEVEATEMVEHGLPGRVVGRKTSPGIPGPYDIEDGVDDASQRARARSTSPLLWRKKLLDTLPLRVGQLTGVRRAHATERMVLGQSSASVCTDVQATMDHLCGTSLATWLRTCGGKNWVRGA